MNKVEKLKYIKNCSDEYKVLFKFYDYIMFHFNELKDQSLYAEFWDFISFCNNKKYEFNIPAVRKFCTKENYKKVFEDIKIQIADLNKTKKLAWSNNYKIYFDLYGVLQVAIFDDEFELDYPENHDHA